MNLWANRRGQLSILAVALFFFTCQEETSILGYKNPNSKFRVSYVEIPIESSVLLRDSLRTSNFYSFGEPNRLLVGSYTDEVFGNIAASAVSQYFTLTTTKLGSSAVFDSVSLQLRFDLYNYGASAVSPQTISIYELDQELKYDSVPYYFNRTNVPYTNLLGSKTFSINPAKFKEFAESSTDKDTVLTFKVPLDYNFGKRIFDSAIKYRDATSAADSTFGRYNEFVKEFKGIVIKADIADKIIGFNNSSSAAETRITIHYHETDKDSLSFNLGFSGVVGFNQIKSDRAATELSGLNQYYQESLQSNDNRYIQSGTGVLTKLDFSKFYEFADTVPYVLINSAELVIESVQPSSYAPPALLSLRVLKDNNRMKTFSTKRPQDATDYVGHKGYLRYDYAIVNSTPAIADNDSVFYATGDKSPVLGYSTSKNSYNAILSLFFQQLTIKDDGKTRFKSFVLYPAAQSASTPGAQSASKSVNRVVFPKDKIKLKIFYTKPITPR